MSEESKNDAEAFEKKTLDAPDCCAVAAKNVRAGWAESMKEMAARGMTACFGKRPIG